MIKQSVASEKMTFLSIISTVTNYLLFRISAAKSFFTTLVIKHSSTSFISLNANPIRKSDFPTRFPFASYENPPH